MKKLLDALRGPMPVVISLAVVAGVLFLGISRLELMAGKIEKAENELRIANERYKDVERGIKELAAARKDERALRRRLDSDIATVTAAPASVTCGDSVHVAIDLMRDRQGNGSR